MTANTTTISRASAARRTSEQVDFLTAEGLTLSKALQDATAALSRYDTKRAELSAQATATAVLADAYTNPKANIDDALATATRARAALDLLEASNVREILADDQAHAAQADARDAVPTIVDRFNTAADDFTTTWRTHFDAPLNAVALLGTEAGNHYPHLLETGQRLDALADFLDKTIPSADKYGTRYGRNLGHAYAANVTTGRAFQIDNTGGHRSDTRWLELPEAKPIARWLTLLQADARPGTTTVIAYDPEAAANDDLLLERMYAEWHEAGTSYPTLAGYAPVWWEQHRTRRPRR